MGGGTLLFALVAAHAVCDYPLQGDFLARAKNRAAPIPGVPWYQALGAHALIHGGAVALLTGIPLLGLAEIAAHATIDDAKCTGRIGFNADQALHIACKTLWVFLAAVFSQMRPIKSPEPIYGDIPNIGWANAFQAPGSHASHRTAFGVDGPAGFDPFRSEFGDVPRNPFNRGE